MHPRLGTVDLRLNSSFWNAEHLRGLRIAHLIHLNGLECRLLIFRELLESALELTSQVRLRRFIIRGLVPFRVLLHQVLLRHHSCLSLRVNFQ